MRIFLFLRKWIAVFLVVLVTMNMSCCAATNIAFIDVFVNADGNIAFKLSTPGQAGAPISDFGIVEGDGGTWNYTKPAWSVVSVPGRFVNVVEIIYGSSPPGFASSIATPLVSGRHYMAQLNGAGIATGIEFVVEIVDGKKIVHPLGMARAHPREIDPKAK